MGFDQPHFSAVMIPAGCDRQRHSLALKSKIMISYGNRMRSNERVLRVPPLRDRPEDIVPLAEYFLSRMNRELNRNVNRIPMAYIKALEAYDWPGGMSGNWRTC